MRISNTHPPQSVWALICLIAILLAAGSGGCAAHSKTYKKTTVSSEEPQTTVETRTYDSDAATDVDTVDTEEETTTTTETTTKEPRGVIGTTFNFIGKVIAFPFRLIAGIFEAIF